MKAAHLQRGKVCSLCCFESPHLRDLLGPLPSWQASAAAVKAEALGRRPCLGLRVRRRGGCPFEREGGVFRLRPASSSLHTLSLSASYASSVVGISKRRWLQHLVEEVNGNLPLAACSSDFRGQHKSPSYMHPSQASHRDCLLLVALQPHEAASSGGNNGGRVAADTASKRGARPPSIWCSPT